MDYLYAHVPRCKRSADPIRASRGVKQGGLYSPYLFALCLDELAIEIETIPYGVISKSSTLCPKYLFMPMIFCVYHEVFWG